MKLISRLSLFFKSYILKVVSDAVKFGRLPYLCVHVRLCLSMYMYAVLLLLEEGSISLNATISSVWSI